MLNLRDSVKAGVGWTGIAAAVRLAAYGIQFLVLARFLGPREYGVAALAIVVTGFAQTFVDAGMSAAVVQAGKLSIRTLSTLYWLNIGLGIALFAACFPLGALTSIWFSEPRLTLFAPAAGAMFLIAPWGKQFEALLQREMEFQQLAIADSMSAIAGTVAATIMAGFGLGAWSVILALLCDGVTRTAQLIASGVKRWRPIMAFDFMEAKPLMIFGAYQVSERLLGYASLRLDQVAVGLMLGTEALGYYGFANNLVLQPQFRINPIVNRVAFPAFALIRNDTSRLKRGYLEVSEKLALLNMPVLLGLAAVAPIAVPVIFGQRWAPAVTLTQILCLYAAVRSTGNPVGNLLLAKGRAGLSFVWNLVAFPCITAGIFAGSRIAGLAGIALALLMLQIGLSVLNYVWLVRCLIGPCSREYLKALGIPFVLSAAMALTVWSSQLLLPAGACWALMMEITAGSALYVALVVVFRKTVFNEIVSGFRISWRGFGSRRF